jgi:uncharacterized protein (DUF1501 family)
MNRRKFLILAGCAVPVVWGSYHFSPFPRFFASPANYRNRVLVLIQLGGGNDTLNTVIPISKYNILSEARKNILIPERKILKLNDTDSFGFHPSLTGMQRLYNDKKISIVHGVGYPNPDLSHFKGTDIKITANCGAQDSKSGWVGRYLEGEYKNFPKGHPLHQGDGPPCVCVGGVSPKISRGADIDLSVGFSTISDFDLLAPNIQLDAMPNNAGGAHISEIRSLLDQIKLYAPAIKSVAGKQSNRSKLYPEPGKNKLADHLKTVAALIGGDLRSPIYVVSQSDYDTHGDQVEKSDTTKGQHAQLLSDLSEAITAFEDDMHLMGKQDDVLGMTFSEFGRRIKSNESNGTDHGTAEAVILFGSKLKETMIGTAPELPSRPTSEDNLPLQFDFRALYASVLKGWFGVPEDKLKSIIQEGPSDRLDLFKA